MTTLPAPRIVHHRHRLPTARWSCPDGLPFSADDAAEWVRRELGAVVRDEDVYATVADWRETPVLLMVTVSFRQRQPGDALPANEPTDDIGAWDRD